MGAAGGTTVAAPNQERTPGPAKTSQRANTRVLTAGKKSGAAASTKGAISASPATHGNSSKTQLKTGNKVSANPGVGKQQPKMQMKSTATVGSVKKAQ
jgi:hypothetical protein